MRFLYVIKSKALLLFITVMLKDSHTFLSKFNSIIVYEIKFSHSPLK